MTLLSIDNRPRPAPWWRCELESEGLLIARWVRSSKIERQAPPPATRRLLKRGYSVLGDERFQRLAGVSVSPIFNLLYNPRASAA